MRQAFARALGRLGKLWPAGRALPVPSGWAYSWRRDARWFDVPEARPVPPVRLEVIDALCERFPNVFPTIRGVDEGTGAQLLATVARQHGQQDVIRALIEASLPRT